MRKNFPGLIIETLPSGNKRLRVRVEGNKNRKIRLRVDLDHPKFTEHYWNARAGIALPAEPETTAIPRSLSWLKDKYLIYLEQMAENGQASPHTLRQRRSLLNRMCKFVHEDTGDQYGVMTMDAPQSAFVTLRNAMAHTPAEADNMMKAGKAMYKWACDTGKSDINPIAGITRIHKSKGGATPWTAADLRAFKKAHPIGTMAHLALTLHMFTACRSNDAIWLGRPNMRTVAGEKILQWQPRKKGSAEVQMPLAAPLHRAINAVAMIGPAFILSEHGKPFKSPDSYRNRFRKWCDEAGLEGRSSHGVRKAMAELLAEEGCSEHQIMAVLSHTKASTSAIYTKGAERRLMAAEAMASIRGLDW